MKDLELNRSEQIAYLLEGKKLYLSPYFTKKIFYQSLNFKSEKYFDNIFYEIYQDNWDSVIRHLRLVYARELMLNYDVLYEYIWRFSGFKSRKNMEKEINMIVL